MTLKIPTDAEAVKPIAKGLIPSFDILLRFVCKPNAAIANNIQYFDTSLMITKYCSQYKKITSAISSSPIVLKSEQKINPTTKNGKKSFIDPLIFTFLSLL